MPDTKSMTPYRGKDPEASNPDRDTSGRIRP